MNLTSFVPGKPVGNCCCPPDAIYVLQEELEWLTEAGGTSSSTKVRGAFVEKLTGEGKITAKGTMNRAGCGGSIYLHLDLPISVLLRANVYSSLVIELPSRLSIVDRRLTFKSALQPNGPETSLVFDGKIEPFGWLSFTFYAASGETSFGATYSLSEDTWTPSSK